MINIGIKKIMAIKNIKECHKDKFLNLNKTYCQFTLSISLTASGLYLPKSATDVLSILNPPKLSMIGCGLTFSETGYSKVLLTICV